MHLLPTDKRTEFSIGNFVAEINQKTGESKEVDADQDYFVIVCGDDMINRGQVPEGYLEMFTNQHRSYPWN